MYCNGRMTPSRFSPPLYPSFPVTYVVYYFPGFLSSPSLLRLFLGRSRVCSWTFAVLPFLGTHSSFESKLWVGYLYVSVSKFSSLVSSFRYCAVLCSHTWGFLGPKGNSGRRACCTILESVCDWYPW
jgi:hypothetical protein